MKLGWKSCAKWPEKCCPGLGNFTEDRHESQEQADAVCELLTDRGFGGEGQFFPVMAWVERVGLGVVFLDFDGVILTLRTCAGYVTSWGRALPDPVLTNALRRVCETGIKIVVSSAWRDHEESCKAKLVECGLHVHLHDDWRTKEMRSMQAHSDRPSEVADWLSRHPEITDYRILDDDPWAWTEDQSSRFLKCSPEDGASAQVILELVRWAGMKLQDHRLSRAHASTT